MKPTNEVAVSLARAPSWGKEVRLPTYSTQLIINSLHRRRTHERVHCFQVCGPRSHTNCRYSVYLHLIPLHLTRDNTIAVELGRHGITVNAYAPGPIVTAMRE